MRTLGLGILLIASVPVFADTFTLNYANFSGVSQTYATVTVTADATLSNTLDVEVDLANNLKFVNTGYDASFGFDLSGSPTISFSHVSTGWSTIANTAGSLKFDGVGNFEYGLNCTACGSGGSNPQLGPLDFDITAPGLTVASLEVLSSHGYYMGADVIDYNVDGHPTGAIATSGLPSTGLSTAPEPASIALMAGVLGLCGFSAKKKLLS